MLPQLGTRPNQFSVADKPFARLDKVRLSGGQVMIVTGYHPQRPANCYTGVLEKGQGAEYKFGAKHRPVKIGTVNEGHPALLNNQTRKSPTGPETLEPSTKVLMGWLVDAVLGNDTARALETARTLRNAGIA